ncbi:amidase [Chelativorans sp. Marseille-P2723]|uniref:amidase n=1 Tax=Chelativorans sp. Marseille-P2723 TaxID=2709133 RepID=UPI0015700246|nr:amidase [Chelativorans sp. Marseille-P2723]
MNDIHRLAISEIRAHLQDGTLTATQVTVSMLERAHAIDHRLNAFVSIEDEQALRRAEELDKAGFDGSKALWGIPVAQKDMFARPGRQPRCGVGHAVEGLDLPDSPVIAAFEAAGSVDLGPLTMAEFALGTTGTNAFYGNAGNPWDLDRCTGASSSGSAAAVAAGVVAGSLGTDTGASVRMPASFCGVVGLKPTAGAIASTGVFPAAWSLDSVGVITRSIEDCALLFSVAAGRDVSLAEGVRQPLTIGVPDRYYTEHADPQVVEAWLNARATMEKAGFRVVDTAVVETPEIRSLLRIIMRAEAACVHRELMAKRPENYPMAVRKFISSGEGVLGVDYIDALRLRATLLKSALSTNFAQADVLMTPTVPVLPPRYTEISDAQNSEQWRTVTLLAHYTQPASYLGLPAISVPYSLSAEGLPIGMQLIGAPWSEASLFQSAVPLQKHWLSLGAVPPEMS